MRTTVRRALTHASRSRAISSSTLRSSSLTVARMSKRMGSGTAPMGRMNIRVRGMATIDVPVPVMGESISEGAIEELFKAVGDAVAVDEVIGSIETDKVSIDIMAPSAGVITAMHVAEGDTVNVGAAFCSIDSEATGGATSAPAAAEEAAASPAAAAPAGSSSGGEIITISVPTMGESITEGSVGEWLKQVGDGVQKDEVVVIIETDKVSQDIQAPEAGTITSHDAEEGDTVTVGDAIFNLDTGNVQAVAAAAAPAAPAAAAPAAAAPAPAAAPPAAAAAAADDSSDSVFGLPRGEERVALTRMRKAIIKNLKGSQNNAAQLTTFQECDMGALMDMRKEYKEEFEKINGVKLGFMGAFVRAAASGLMEIPGVNATIDEKTDEIVYRDYADVSIAVATPKGLVTPAIRNAESMSIAEIETEMGNLATKARDGKLAMEDLMGGTFTISNGGVFGSLMGTPIPPSGQSCVLGMHAIKMRAVVDRDGNVVARPMMYLALTYDHRIVDGREAVTFLKGVADRISDPRRLVLGI